MILYHTVNLPPRLMRVGPWMRDQLKGQSWMGPGPWPADEDLGPVQTSVVDGLAFRTIKALPALVELRQADLPPWHVTADLPGIGPAPVKPALGSGQRLRMDGSALPALEGSYEAMAHDLFGKVQAGDLVGETDPLALAVAFAALATCHRLTEDLAEAIGALTVETVPALCGAAWTGEKGEPSAASGAVGGGDDQPGAP